MPSFSYLGNGQGALKWQGHPSNQKACARGLAAGGLPEKISVAAFALSTVLQPRLVRKTKADSESVINVVISRDSAEKVAIPTLPFMNMTICKLQINSS